jgi:hypothetical protein
MAAGWRTSRLRSNSIMIPVPARIAAGRSARCRSRRRREFRTRCCVRANAQAARRNTRMTGSAVRATSDMAFGPVRQATTMAAPGMAATAKTATTTAMAA